MASDETDDELSERLATIASTADVPFYEVELTYFNITRILGVTEGRYEAWPAMFETYQETVKMVKRLHELNWLVSSLMPRTPPAVTADEDPIGFLQANKVYIEGVWNDAVLQNTAPASMMVH